MEENNFVEWPPASDHYLKAVFDSITNEFGSPDVDFRAGSRSFEAHKKVLEKHSSVLKSKLSDVWQTSGDVLQLDEEYVEPELIEELLTWIYYTNSGTHWECSRVNAYSLCVAAHYLMIPELVTSCCQVLRAENDEENFYELFTLSKHLGLDDLLGDCVLAIVNEPKTFCLNSQLVKWKTEDLKMLFEALLKTENSPKVLETILSSLAIWAQDSIQDHSQDLDNLLKLFVPPEALSSDQLLGFMTSEFYWKLGESHRKQYYAEAAYLPEGFSSTDKLYCITQSNPFNYRISNCLDLSEGGEWLDLEPERNISVSSQSGWNDIFVVPLGKKIYFFRDIEPRYGHPNSPGKRKRRLINVKVFSTETEKWIDTEEEGQLDFGSDEPMLAGSAMDGYIYITFVGSVLRHCLETHQWETLEKMQTARSKHCLVVLDGLLYAIGGDVLEPDPRPERFDPRANRWGYIAPSNYHHKLPAAVAHEGQIYVLSQVGFEAYSPETDRWTQLPAPGVCIKPSLVSIAGRLWLMTDSVRCPNVRLVYEFNVVDRKWTRLPDMPEGDYTGFSVVIKQ